MIHAHCVSRGTSTAPLISRNEAGLNWPSRRDSTAMASGGLLIELSLPAPSRTATSNGGTSIFSPLSKVTKVNCSATRFGNAGFLGSGVLARTSKLPTFLLKFGMVTLVSTPRSTSTTTCKGSPTRISESAVDTRSVTPVSVVSTLRGFGALASSLFWHITSALESASTMEV